MDDLGAVDIKYKDKSSDENPEMGSGVGPEASTSYLKTK